MVKDENGTLYSDGNGRDMLDRTENMGLLADRRQGERGALDAIERAWTVISYRGHVDETAKCIAMEDADGGTYFTFEYPENKRDGEEGLLHRR